MPLKLYTKTGDTGQSSPLAGIRLPKHHPIFEVLGTTDELNSFIGSAAVLASTSLKAELFRIQKNLLSLGALVAGSTQTHLKPGELKFLESRIDYYQTHTSKDWYTKFLLPGGTELAARLDLARTVCRRLERRLSAFDAQLDQELYITQLNLQTTKAYINRLSDYLFACRCFTNSQANYQEIQFTQT